MEYLRRADRIATDWGLSLLIQPRAKRSGKWPRRWGPAVLRNAVVNHEHRQPTAAGRAACDSSARSRLPAGRSRRAGVSRVSSTARRSAVPVRLALEQTDGSVFHFETRVLPESHPQAAANVTLRRALRQVPAVVAGRLAHLRRRTGIAGGGTGRALPRHADRQIRRPLRRRARCSIIRWRSCTRATCRRNTPRPSRSAAISTAAASASISAAAIARSQRVIDGARRLQRRDGLGSVLQARSAVSLRRHHGLADEGGGASSARRRHRRQRGRRLREQSGQGRVALSRRAARTCSTRACEDLFLEIRKAWNDVPFEVVNDGEVTALAGSMSLGTERHSRHRARHQHGRRLRHAGRQHHVVAQRARVRADRLQPCRAGRRMVGRLRRRLAVLLPAVRRPPDAGRRHRRPGRHAAARAAEAGAGAHGRGRLPREKDLPDDRHLPRLRRRALRGVLRPSTCAGARARHVRPGRRRHRRSAPATCSRSSSRSWRGGLRSTFRTSTTSVTARRLPPPACPHSPGNPA